MKLTNLIESDRFFDAMIQERKGRMEYIRSRKMYSTDWRKMMNENMARRRADSARIWHTSKKMNHGGLRIR